MILFEQLIKEKEYNNLPFGWVLNPETGLIDVEGDVYLSYENLTQIPYKFGKVTGNFVCANNNQLTSLEGSPIEVKDSFFCQSNNLTSLKYCPKIVNGHFYCDNNQLQSTKYLPPMIKNYNECIKEINRQKREYLISMGFDPENKKLFKQLMDALEKDVNNYSHKSFFK